MKISDLTNAQRKYINNFQIQEFNEFYTNFEITNLNENNYFYRWLVDKIRELKKLDNITPTGTIIYRSRIISDSQIGIECDGISIDEFRGFNDKNSREAPFGKSCGGRCNGNGISYFYGANNEYTALVEVRPCIFDFISLAKFKTKEPLKIADIMQYTDDFEIFYKRLNDLFSALPDDKTYKASQYISDLFRKYGFDGIKYRSSLSAGINYVIFNSTKDNLEFNESHIICLSQIDCDFKDLKTKNPIEKNLKKEITLTNAITCLRNTKKNFKEKNNG